MHTNGMKKWKTEWNERCEGWIFSIYSTFCTPRIVPSSVIFFKIAWRKCINFHVLNNMNAAFYASWAEYNMTKS